MAALDQGRGLKGTALALWSMRYAYMLVLLSSTPSACGPHVPPKAPEPAVAVLDDPDAYAIYAMLLPKEWPLTVAKAGRLVILSTTVTAYDCFPSGTPIETELETSC